MSKYMFFSTFCLYAFFRGAKQPTSSGWRRCEEWNGIYNRI